MYNINPILNADSYKLSHFLFYPEGTTNVYSYMESRGGKYDETLFFGLQGFLKEYLSKPITRLDIKYAKGFAAEHGLPFNEEGWLHILNKHDGYLPVEIKAVPEGMVIPNHNVLMTVENTDPAVPFITSYIETMALRLWYPITVATRGLNMKRAIKGYYEATSDTMDMSFSVLDFSARGCTSFESNAIGGAAHLVNFAGSDSMGAIDYVKQLYGGKIVGYSVPATEHSIMCAYGHNNELASFERMVDIAQPGSVLSVVSDTWNIYEAVEKWITLREKIQNKGITLVIRPDSGDIGEVLDRILPAIANGFGTTKNNKGYHVINGAKVLWGDGMNEDTITLPFYQAMMHDISADSVMAGSGGGLLQANLDCDTNKFAFKASNITINGVDKPIAKDPITDHGKQSKKGRMELHSINGHLHTITDGMARDFSNKDLLEVVYRNGSLIRETTMEEIRNLVTL